MLVRFALEVEAINNDIRSRDIRDFEKKWKNCGIMVYPDPRDGSIINVIKGLNQGPRMDLIKVWEKLLKKNDSALRCQPLEKNSFDWETILSNNGLAKQKDKFDVALLKESSALALRIPDGQRKLFGEVEGVRFVDIDRSKLEQCLSFDIEYDDWREHIWKDHFEDLSRFSLNVVIADPYAVTDGNIEGIFWLLSQLKKNSKKYHVTIYSAVRIGERRGNRQDKRQREKIAREIESDFKNFYDEKIGKESGISIEVRLYVPDVPSGHRHKKHPHDRHIRFDNHVIEIGVGLGIFKSEQVDDLTSGNQKVLPDGEKERKEIALDKRPERLILAFKLPEP